jgi:hypothetical protein
MLNNFNMRAFHGRQDSQAVFNFPPIV